MTGGEEEVEGKEPDFLQVLRERMAPAHRQAGEVIDRLNAVYIETGRDKAIRGRFDRFLTFVTAKQRHGRQGKGNAFFLTGESGAGKTDLVEHLIASHPVLQPMQHRSTIITPWIRIALQGPATLRVLGADILAAIQYPVKPSAREAEVWRILPHQLAEARVFLIHIDETQHLMARGSDSEVVASAIKGLMNNSPWPVSFILSGKPKLNDLILHDDQAERRSYSIEIPALHPTEDRDMIAEIVKRHCEAVPINCSDILATDMPERIAHAANYQFGRICEVTIAGIHIAVLEAAAELKRSHFARAYRDHSHTSGRDEMNPFHAEDWTSLRPGYFVRSGET